MCAQVQTHLYIRCEVLINDYRFTWTFIHPERFITYLVRWCMLLGFLLRGRYISWMRLVKEACAIARWLIIPRLSSVIQCSCAYAEFVYRYVVRPSRSFSVTWHRGMNTFAEEYLQICFSTPALRTRTPLPATYCEMRFVTPMPCHQYYYCYHHHSRPLVRRK